MLVFIYEHNSPRTIFPNTSVFISTVLGSGSSQCPMDFVFGAWLRNIT